VNSAFLIIISEILGSVGRVAEYIDRVAHQQCASLRLVIGGDIVDLSYLLAQNAAVTLIGVLGTNEDAHAVMRLGIKITDVPTAEVVDYEAVRWQRVDCLLAGGIVGKVHLESCR